MKVFFVALLTVIVYGIANDIICSYGRSSEDTGLVAPWSPGSQIIPGAFGRVGPIINLSKSAIKALKKLKKQQAKKKGQARKKTNNGNYCKNCFIIRMNLLLIQLLALEVKFD